MKHVLRTSATPPTWGGELNGLQGAACTVARGLCLINLSSGLISILCFGSVGRNWPYLQACLQAGEVGIPQSGCVTVCVL
jgi:hypothetical protein